MSEPTRYADFPLRARKRARTRVALVEALTVRLVDQSLDEVPVSELCDEVGISQGTFFNHFPSKAHLLTHFIQLWSLKVALLGSRAAAEHASPLAAIEALFAATADETRAYPRVMSEIIAHQARGFEHEGMEPVELVERLLFLDDDPEAASLPDEGLSTLLSGWLAAAVARGLLPEGTDVMELTLAVASVFFGVPLLLGRESPELVGPLYARQLQLVWAGARSRWG